MHPHSQLESDSLSSDHYGIYARLRAHPLSIGVDGQQGSVIAEALVATVGDQPIDPFVSGTITADLEQPVVSAELRLHLGKGPLSLSPFMSNGAHWNVMNPETLLFELRPLFDPGIYIALDTKCVSLTPRLITPPAPTVQAVGPLSAGFGVRTVVLPPHQKDDIAELWIESHGDAISLAVANGFVEAPNSPQFTTGGAGGSVAFDAASEFERTGTTDPQTWTHTPTGTPRAIIVGIVSQSATTDFVVSVTYGGVAMTRIVGISEAGEAGYSQLWFLGAGIPTGPQTVSVDLSSATTANMHFSCASLTASGDCEVLDFDSVNGDAANPSLTLQYGGRNAMAFAMLFSGLDAPASITYPAGVSLVNDYDLASQSSSMARQTTSGTADFTIGYTSAIDDVAMVAIAVGQVATVATRLACYWFRCTGNAMPAPQVAAGTDHIVARIVTVRGAITTGSPFDSSAGSVLSTPASLVNFPTMVTTADRCLITMGVAAPISGGSVGSWTYTSAPGTGTFPTEVTDSFTAMGAGGGFAVARATQDVRGGIRFYVATLSVAATQAKLVLAIKPPPPHEENVDPAQIPWRPIFQGRIDDCDPAADDKDVLVIHARDLFSDLLDTWVEPPDGQNGWTMDDGTIDDLLPDIMAHGTGGHNYPFAIIGDPNMTVPPFIQEPMSTLLAMRQAGLQNGWDLRPRWGTAPYGEDVYVLTYYEPDRALAGGRFVLGPDRYFRLNALTKSRAEVRTIVEVLTGSTPRVRVRRQSLNSTFKYGELWMQLAEDAASLIMTQAQGERLADAVLSDVKEPKVMASLETRLLPFVEINDLLQLSPNGVHHDQDMLLAVSGYVHTFTEDGDATTTLTTRDAPAAANREWRRSDVKKDYASTDLPSGPAPEGSTWATYSQT